jgi:hypothetical protein
VPSAASRVATTELTASTVLEVSDVRKTLHGRTFSASPVGRIRLPRKDTNAVQRPARRLPPLPHEHH